MGGWEEEAMGLMPLTLQFGWPYYSQRGPGQMILRTSEIGVGPPEDKPTPKPLWRMAPSNFMGSNGREPTAGLQFYGPYSSKGQSDVSRHDAYIYMGARVPISIWG